MLFDPQRIWKCIWYFVNYDTSVHGRHSGPNSHLRDSTRQGRSAKDSVTWYCFSDWALTLSGTSEPIKRLPRDLGHGTENWFLALTRSRWDGLSRVPHGTVVMVIVPNHNIINNKLVRKCYHFTIEYGVQHIASRLGKATTTWLVQLN